MIEHVFLENFTVFDQLDLPVSPGINAFIGNNGTGKTHLLKVIYSSIAAHTDQKDVIEKLVGVFLPLENRIGRLVTRRAASTRTHIRIIREGEALELVFSNHSKESLKSNNAWRRQTIGKPVYIPVKEMLANAPGFLALYQKFALHFEEVYADILYQASIPPLRGPAEQKRKQLLEKIQRVIEGKIVQKSEQFFLKNRQGELEFTLLAEGMRKLGLIWLLIQNGTLIEGATLFWDEPEANLNPGMLSVVAEILLQLQRNGVQIFLATHNYVLLKELDLQGKKTDAVRFISLERDEATKKITHRSGDRYLDIVPNRISEAYTDIYDAEVRKSLGVPSR